MGTTFLLPFLSRQSVEQVRRSLSSVGGTVAATRSVLGASYSFTVIAIRIAVQLSENCFFCSDSRPSREPVLRAPGGRHAPLLLRPRRGLLHLQRHCSRMQCGPARVRHLYPTDRHSRLGCAPRYSIII